jgi:hypothetical protein
VSSGGPSLARLVAWALILVHAGLAVWAFVGFAELALSNVPWTRLSNPLFSRVMLALQWSLIASAALVFVAGYFGRWRRTPVAMLVIYAAMALVCAYQTFFILTHSSRFREMAIEYAEYAVILAFLFRSKHMREHFA